MPSENKNKKMGNPKGPIQGPPKVPQQTPKLTVAPQTLTNAPAQTPDQVKQDAREQLEQLVSEISGVKRDGLLKALREDGIHYKEWLMHPASPASVKEMRKYLPASAGLEVLIKGLQAPASSPERKQAEEFLGRLIHNIDARYQRVAESEEQLGHVREDAALGSVKDVLNTMVTNYKRGSGAEKVASLAAVGIGLYLLNLIYKTPTGKGVIRFGLGAFAVNIITRLATGKSLLEHLGVGQAKESLAPEIRKLAEKVRIADDPQKLKALAKVGTVDIKLLWQAYYGAQGAQIEPTEFGIYDGSLKGTELYEIMDTLVLKAGNGDRTKGQKFFQEKFLRGDRQWNLFEVSMSLFSQEALRGIRDAELSKYRAELREIFKNHPDYGLMMNDDMTVSVLGCPMYGVQRIENEKDNPVYIFEVEPGKSVTIPMKQSAAERSASMLALTEVIKTKIKNLLPNDPKLRNAKIERKGSGMILVGVEIDGKKYDLEVAFDDTNPEKPVLKLLYQGQVVKAFVTLNETVSAKDLENAQYALKLTTTVPILRGLDVRVYSVTDNPAAPGYKYIQGEVAGEGFESVKFMAYEQDGGVYLYQASAVEFLKNEAFLARKKRQAEEELRANSGKLKDIIHQVPERIWRITALWKGASGSIRENLFEASVDAKTKELVEIYIHKLRNAKSLDEAQAAWNNVISKGGQDFDNLEHTLFEAVRDDKKFSDEDFKTTLDQLDTIEYASPELQGVMLAIRNRMLEFDYNGLDQSDITKMATQVYGATREVINHFTKEFATEQSLMPNQIAYLRYLEGVVVDQLARIQIKSTGLLGTGLKKTVDLGNFPESTAQWGIKEYKDWAATHPDAGKEKGPQIPKVLADVQNRMLDVRDEVIRDAQTAGKSNHDINETLDRVYGKASENWPVYQAKSKEIAAIADSVGRETALKKYRKDVRHEFGLK